MGDTKRIRKKYETPRHPWVGSRIAEEKILVYAYGLGNKKEVWRMGTTLKQYKDRVKRLLARSDHQALVEQQQLIEKMARLGLIKHGATFDDILGLSIEAVMERRLQTLLVKKNLARTHKQARQMITHRHVTVGGKVVTAPSYLVSLDEEHAISFATRSGFINEAHPERLSEDELLRKKAKEEAKQKTIVKEETDGPITFDEKAIEQAEVLAGEKKVDSVKEAVKEEAKKPAEKPADKPAEKPEEPELEKAAPVAPEPTPESAEAQPESPVEQKKEDA